jgi:hypothetical protein
MNPIIKLNKKKILGGGFLVLVVIVGVILVSKRERADATSPSTSSTSSPQAGSGQATLDTVAYDAKLLQLANNPAPKVVTPTANATTVSPTTKPIIVKPLLWPVKTVYPDAGALLPFNRIIAFYGNFYSKNMGILGQYPTDTVISKLNDVVAQWQVADPSTPVIPAIHYIAETAQRDAGPDGLHIFRMPKDQIQRAIDLANQIHGIAFLDLQIGKSTVTNEINIIKPFLIQPNVHLGLDPEFAMKNGKKPGKFIGTMDASEINQAISILSQIVIDNHLPPKILVIHRFTFDMVTNYKQIKPTPQVQVVMDMDGWGTPPHKTKTYHDVTYSQPVQFTGFKLFYKNDLQKPDMRMMTPAEVLKLRPIPSYIQYQ